MQQRGIKNIALVYNKIEPPEFVRDKHYVGKCLKKLLPNVPVLDCITNHTQLDNRTKQQSATKITQRFNSQPFD